MAQGANSGLPILVERYRLEGDRAIAKAADREAAEVAIAAIKEKWKAVWKAWEAIRVAEDTWATALEEGGDLGAALPAMKAAYCGLVRVWPDDIPAIPIALVRCPK
ncbi:MAG: hypothetical protein ACYTF5_21835 [Planctomycetota bacterium]